MKRWVVNSTHPLKQIVMTKKELLEAIKDMPEDAVLEFYHRNILGGYAKVTDVEYIKEDNTITLS